MKKISFGLVIIALSSGLYTPKSEADQMAQAICGYVQSDHKSRLRDQLRSNKLKLKRIYDGLACNNNSLLRFAMLNDADKVGRFIAKRLNASILARPEADGQTILQWADVNGKSETLTVKAIRKRMKI